MYELPKKKQNINAFTLIEVLVSISIMAILFTIGIANFRGTQRTKSLDAVRNQIVSDLRRTQQYAQGGIKPASCNGDLEYVVLAGIDNYSYKIYTECVDDDDNHSTVDIKSEIRVPNLYNLNIPIVQFKPVGGGVEDSRTITIYDTGNALTITITITEGGEII